MLEQLEPCGTPDVIWLEWVVNTCVRPVRYERNHSSGCSVTENLNCRIDSRVAWSTESKAELRLSKASAAT